MKRSAFKRKAPQQARPDRSGEFASWEPKPRAVAVSMPSAPSLTVPIPKGLPVIRDEGYRRLVALLPCALCGIHGSSQAAHPNAGKTKGRKACDALCFPLCHAGANGCHQAWDEYQLGGRLVQSEREPELAKRTQDALRELARYDSKARAILERIGLC